MAAELVDSIRKWGSPRVLVVGDVMLDRYVWGDAERISQEAPVILLRADKREERLGGASSVATMLQHLRADVVIAGVIGRGDDAQKVRDLLDGLDIDQSAIVVDDDRPTTVKERYIGRAQHKHPQQMLRVDFESREPVTGEVEGRLCSIVQQEAAKADVVLISDYDKGVCTFALTQVAIQAAKKRGIPVLVDPIRCKPDASPHPFEKYRGCTTMTPNRLEASLATGMPVRSPDEALKAGHKLLEDFNLDVSIITLDKDGMALFDPKGVRQIFSTRTRHVYDITGAGDMVLSVLGLALASGCDFSDAIRLANVAGGLEVEKIGVAPVSREEMIDDILVTSRIEQSGSDKVMSLPFLREEVVRLKDMKKKVVFTNGCFDILHAGHVQYLKDAREQGDLLIVALNSDSSVRALKGKGRPVNTESDRASVLAALGVVDYITIFEDETPLNLIKTLQPDVLVKGADYSKAEVVGSKEVESWGGRVYLAPLREGCSTTGTLSKLRKVA